jgi:hypothetical protein
MYSVLLCRASSHVKATNFRNLNYSRVVLVHLHPSALVVTLVSSLESMLTPSVKSQVDTTSIREMLNVTLILL